MQVTEEQIVAFRTAHKEFYRVVCCSSADATTSDGISRAAVRAGLEAALAAAPEPIRFSPESVIEISVSAHANLVAHRDALRELVETKRNHEKAALSMYHQDVPAADARLARAWEVAEKLQGREG